MSESRNGKIKFYSIEKGFGFIFDEFGGSDLFFHISDIKGAAPPSVGDDVLFEIYDNIVKGRPAARNVVILDDAGLYERPNRPLKSLDGFPCIRGDTIHGFIIERRIGRITAGQPVLRWFPAFNTVSAARDALTAKAKRRGANAIVNFSWHNDRRRQERVFSKSFYFEDNFWVEGDAVVMVSERS